MKNIVRQLVIALLSVALLVYLGMQTYTFIGSTLNVDHAVYTTTVGTISTEAQLFRDEMVLRAASTGTNCYYFEDGTKVAANENILATYTLSSDAALQEQINDLTRKIRILEKSSVEKSFSTTDLSRLDGAIASRVTEIIRNVDSGYLQKASLNLDELLININRRVSVASSTTSYEMKLDDYNDQITALQNRIQGNRNLLSAPVPGYFFSTVDGYEEIFTVRALEKLTLDNYAALKLSAPDESILGNAIGKLVLSPKWYITVQLSKREASVFTDSNSPSAKFEVVFPYSSSRSVFMTLDKTISQTDIDDVVLVFSSDTLPDGFNYSRTQSVHLVTSANAGLKIPVTALRMVNGVTGVYCLDGKKVVFKTTSVLLTENGYYICALPDEDEISLVSPTKLSLYDVVIVSGRDLYDGKILQ